LSLTTKQFPTPASLQQAQDELHVVW